MAVRTADVADVDFKGVVKRGGHVPARVVPFAVLAIAAEASVALPPGPTSDRDVFFSVVLLGLSAVLYIVAARPRFHRVAVAIPLSYIASVLMLVLGSGGSTTGIGLIILLPVIWAALNVELIESLIVVIAMVSAEWVTTVTPIAVTNTIRARRELSFLLIGILIVVSIHELRSRIQRSNLVRDVHNEELSVTILELSEQTRIAAVLDDLVDGLSFCNVVEEAYEVIEFAVRQIFVDGGSINVLNRSSENLETKCAWPVPRGGESPFPPSSCIAIVNGQPYGSQPALPRCGHFPKSLTAATQCHPLLINQEVVGLLSVLIPDDSEKKYFDVVEQYRRYARLIGDQISIWLSNFRLRESLNNLSIRDPLTNLFNRRFMIETLHREMTITTRSHDEISIMQIDIDNFKEFNDSFGHDVGDAVLVAVADVMLSVFRESDVPCRSGGEEFTLILPRCSWEIANLRAIELQALVATIVIEVPENQVKPRAPTLSIGIATSPEHGMTGDVLLRAADAAMYCAKATGRNRIVRASVTVGA
jgi:diguanylate cyclase (GGDEF)-like protein